MYPVVGRELDTGPTARTVAENVKRLRTDQDMNYTELSERLQAVANWSVNAVGIRRIESGERRVTADDLVALSLALGVSPSTLLMPARDAEDNPIEAATEIDATGFSNPIAAQTFWEWLLAADPLDENVSLFIERSWPVWVQRTWHEQARAAQKKAMEGLYRNMPGGVPQESAGTDGDD